jgi:hypothetical protein
MHGAVQRLQRAAKGDAGRAPGNHEDRGARGAAARVGHARHREEQIRGGAIGDEGLHAADAIAVAGRRRRGARPLARVGEGEGGGQLAAQHGHEKALALRGRPVAEQTAGASDHQAAQHGARGRDRLVQRDLPQGAKRATAQLGGLGEPEDPGRLRAHAHPAAQLG